MQEPCCQIGLEKGLNCAHTFRAKGASGTLASKQDRSKTVLSFISSIKVAASDPKAGVFEQEEPTEVH